MPRFRSKIKGHQLIVRVRLSSKEKIDERELDSFSRKVIRGMMKAAKVDKLTFKGVEYSGPVGVSLAQRLQKPVERYDFFFMMEQIVDTVQKLQANALETGRIIWDIQNVFINETTREMQFIYLPLEQAEGETDITGFMESVIYAMSPAPGQSTEYLSEFTYFLKGLKSFDAEKIEQYILRRDKGIVKTIKKHGVGQSGFITDKPQDYYAHYDGTGKGMGPCEEEATGLLDEEEATGLLHEEEATGLLNESRAAEFSNGDSAAGFIGGGGTAGFLYEEATGLLNESNAAGALYEEEATGLLNGDHAEGGLEEDGATGLLTEEDLYEEGTGMLSREDADRYCPFLYRAATEQKIRLNKPVFRIGKERSCVDLCIADNSAVSRSHADIITRGRQYFVLDLDSTNKTYINGRPIPARQEAEIRDGDQLRLANEEFVFYV